MDVSLIRVKTSGVFHSLKMSRSIPEFFFFVGYDQIVPPRIFRKIFARTECHRAWLSGYTGAWLASVSVRYPTDENCLLPLADDGFIRD